MSLFLAPIHYKVFGKVVYQVSLINSLFEAYPNPDLEKEFKQSIGPIENKDLKDLIDHDNIHGWLQEKIEICEKFMAKTVEDLLNNGVAITSLEEFFYQKGQELKGYETCSDLVGKIFDSFPDGMPCDRAIEALDLGEDQASWRINTDLHGKFWKDGGQTYYRLRDSWTKGISQGNNFSFSKDEIYEVERCTE
ncbi:MAG: hypothetical protein Q4E36_04390 [Bacillota bacterium]|nr:hypothetical protein [Bacillota bacterium]